MNLNNSLVGQFLVASPSLKDPNFEKTVTLVCEQNESGSLGLIINKPLHQDLEEVINQMNLNEIDTKEISFLQGGPVGLDRGFVIHNSGLWKNTTEVNENTFITSSRDIIDDIIDGVVGVLDKPATPSCEFDPLIPDPAISNAPFRVFNIGNGNPTQLMSFIAALEDAFGKKAQMNILPMQPGDVTATAADVSAIQQWTGFKPKTKIQEGVAKFAAWYLDYKGIECGHP